MGLDSVELVMEWERNFNIVIPDFVAEKINTVQQAVDAISKILNISDDSTELRDKVSRRLQGAMVKAGLINSHIDRSDLVSKIFPENDRQTWLVIASELGLKIPFPPKKHDGTSLKSKFFKILSWTPKFDYTKLTFSELTDVICGSNCQSLIDTTSIKTSYEIYIVLMATTVENIGIGIYEFKPEKTFTGDFGID